MSVADVPTEARTTDTPMKAASAPPRRHGAVRWILPLALVVLGFTTPLVVTNPYRLTLLVDGITLGLLALSLSFLVHQLGLFSFGAGAFYGISAYGFAVAATEWQWPTAAAAAFGIGASVAVSAAVGAVFIRVRALPFAMVTLAFAVMLMQLVQLSEFRNVFGGDSGVVTTSAGALFGVTPERLAMPDGIWPLAWGAMVVCAAGVLLLGRSKFGRLLRGIRENEERMRYCGFNTYWPRLAAFVIASAIAAVAGIIQIAFHGFATPSMFSFAFTGNAIVAALVGGVASVVGAVAGGVLFVQAQAWLSASGDLLLYQGIITALVVIFLPRGLAGLLGDVAKMIRSRARRGDRDA
jgi:branched-chain amino acid transport system permease protein